MSTRAQKVRLGVFMLLSVLLFLGAVGTLAGIKMFNPRDRYDILFRESVSGLEVGSTVKMKGVRVGQVEKIHIGADVETVRVTLALNPGTPITVDTRAVMTAIGITGLQFVELTGGSARSKRVPPNTDRSFIQPGSSTLQTLTGKATSIALKMEGLLNNLLDLTTEPSRVRVRSILDNTDKLLVSADQVIVENRERLRNILANMDRTTRTVEKAANTLNKVVQTNADNLQEAIDSAARAARSIDKAVQNLKVNSTLSAISGAAGSLKKRVDDPAITQVIKNLDDATAQIGRLGQDLAKVVRSRDRQLQTLLADLNTASDYLKDFSRAIKERPSLLLRGETLKEKDLP